jgi:hypothetical protein
LTGVVSIRVAREGEFVAAGSPVVTVVDLTDVWVRAEVEETLLGRLVLGQSLKVILASDLELVGEVTFISPEAGFATQRDVDRVKRDIRTFGIKVALDNPDGRIHPGMTAFVEVPGEGTSPTAAGNEETPALQAPPQPSPATERPAVLTGTAIAAPATAKTAREPKPKETRRSGEKPASAAPVLPIPEKPASTAGASPTRPTLGEDRASSAAPPGRKPESGRNEPDAAIEEALTPSRPTIPDGPSSESPDLEALLENMDLEDPTDADLALLEEALNAETAALDNAADGTPVFESEPTAKTPSAPPALRLEGISVADGKPVAVINGVRLVEGDSVEGARVVRILQDSVVLEFGGRTITLRF